MSLTKKHEDLILKQALLSPVNKQPATTHNYAEPQVTVYEVLQSLPEIEQNNAPWPDILIFVTLWLSVLLFSLSFWGGLAILLYLRGV